MAGVHTGAQCRLVGAGRHCSSGGPATITPQAPNRRDTLETRTVVGGDQLAVGATFCLAGSVVG